VNKRVTICAITALIFSLAAAAPAAAQATRTWVSGVGDDANPCSRTAPCKTFAGAISKTAASGEINVLDPGGFGGVTITKSISIIAEGATAGVLVSGTNAIIINAGVNDTVVLRGLDIEGLGTGLNGVRFLAGAALHVENCTINNFSGSPGVGISFEPSGAGQLFVKDTIIRGNRRASTGGAILVKPGVAGSATASLDNVRIERNTYGVRVENNSKVSISDSVIANNNSNGIAAISTGGAINVQVTDSVVSYNVASGILSNGANATVAISGNSITGNALGGLTSASSGVISSFGDNNVQGNTPDGAPTTTSPGQI
jgi:hypothetical protein